VASAHPLLVDPAVSSAKLARELAAWERNASDYRQRGMILLRSEGLEVEVAFVGLIPMGTTQLPLVAPTIRLSFENYDLWPPSLTFIDFFSGLPAPCPVPATVSAPDGSNQSVLIPGPDGKQFLCLRGTREYHEHDDHDGDLWALYRGQGYGTLAAISENVLATMTSTIAGVQMQMQLAILAPSQETPLPQAQQAARQARANYDQQINAFNQHLAAVAAAANAKG
jgi:hypothetical protein